LNNKTVRILYLIDGLEGDGAERQLCELVQGIQGVDGYEPHVGVLELNDTGHAWMLEERGIAVNEFVRKYRFDLSPIPRIVAYIRQHKIDVVHAYLSMGSEFGLIAGKYCGIPVITSSIRDGMNGNRREAVRTWYQSHFGDIAVANSMAGFTSRFKNIRDKFRVINNGFDLDRFHIKDAEQSELLEELELTGNERLVCMAARMEPQKDHRTLIAAIVELRRTHPNTLLLLAGQGECREELEEYCRKLGVAENVRFIGHRRDVERLFSICEASVLLTNTDIHLEGISNTIIESMALGVPVIATRGGGTDEILPDTDLGDPPYEYGIKVNAFDVDQVARGLAYLLDDEAARIRIGENAKAMVRARFNLERFIDDNISLYRELEQNGSICQRAVSA
jgi:glycosyltransferase involved in cell wall biosynthesis